MTLSTKLRVLVVDDNEAFVNALVSAFDQRDFGTAGCSEPWRVMSWTKRAQLAFDLILLDMRLGMMPDGNVLHATDLLSHLMTYAPSAKIVVFSQEDISIEECVKCIQRGALTFLPKTTTVDELALVANVYQVIGDEHETREELIRVLWEDVSSSKDGGDGRRLEMLVINIFNSIPTFEVLSHKLETSVGDIDILVENVNRHPFWAALGSVHLVIECKHTSRRPQTKAFTHLQELVKTQGRMSRTGLLVSTAGVTQGFRKLQSERKGQDDIHIFGLDKDNLDELVKTTFDRRDECLRQILGCQ